MKIEHLLGLIVLIALIAFEPICNGLLYFGIWGAIIPFVFLGLVLAVYLACKKGF